MLHSRSAPSKPLQVCLICNGAHAWLCAAAYEAQVQHTNPLCLVACNIQQRRQTTTNKRVSLCHILLLSLRCAHSRLKALCPTNTAFGMDLLALLADSHRDLRTAFGVAIPCLVSVLCHPPSLSQRRVLAALVSLAANHPDNKRRMVDANLVPMAIMLLQSCWDGVRGQAAALLLQLACDSAAFKERIVDAGAVPFLLSTLDAAHPCSDTTRTNAAAVLRSLALSEHARRVIAANGLQLLAGGVESGCCECQALVADVVGMVAGHAWSVMGAAGLQVVVQPLAALLQSPSGACRRAAAVALRSVASCGGDARLAVAGAAGAVVARQLRVVGPHDVEELHVLKQLAAILN